jgi:hypothetical protein
MEVLNLLIVCVDLGYLDHNEVENIRPLIENISRKISGLRTAQLKREV